MASEKQIEAAADQISEGLGAFLRKFCDSEASKRARYYLHEMPKDEWNQMTLMLATEALTASEQAEPAAEAVPEQRPAVTHCDNCGCDWLDNGLNPVGCPYCKQPDGHVRKGDPDMIQELIRQRDEMAKALEPFAAVAECDIGDDETDSDIFLPISRRNARAKPITVGDMRKALAALSSDLKEGQDE